jgi:pimeloyl-ACP methyl ester carboxylesterase
MIATKSSPQPSTRSSQPRALRASGLDACLTRDIADRLSEIAAPTLVLSGGIDVLMPPRFGRSVAATISSAHFEVMAEEAHEPFQEVPND